jgi:hypothetical protein
MTKFKDLKVGEKLSETQYYSVVKISGNRVQLKPDSGDDIVVPKEYVESFLTSSAQYTSEETKTRTEMAALFLSSIGVAMTVNFNTQVKEKDAVEQLVEIYPNKGGKMASEADYKKRVASIISSVITGKERTMVGRHYGSVNEFGRVSFIDMEVEKDTSKPEYDSRTRQVDPRTINWMIIRGVKYKTK